MKPYLFLCQKEKELEKIIHFHIQISMKSTFFIPEKVDFQKLRIEESQQMFDMPTLLPHRELGTTSDIVNSGVISAKAFRVLSFMSSFVVG